MQSDRIMSMLSLAQKAGQVKSGEFAVEKAVKEGKAFLVVVAADSSENTKKKMQNMTDFYKIPLYFYSDKESLGRQLGKEYRSMAAVMQSGFAESIKKQLELRTITTE